MAYELDPAALAQMRQRGGNWAVYENKEMGHPNAGHLQFLKYGNGCAYDLPPAQYPNTGHGLGWRYRFEELVCLEDGDVLHCCLHEVKNA